MYVLQKKMLVGIGASKKVSFQHLQTHVQLNKWPPYAHTYVRPADNYSLLWLRARGAHILCIHTRAVHIRVCVCVHASLLAGFVVKLARSRGPRNAAACVCVCVCLALSCANTIHAPHTHTHTTHSHSRLLFERTAAAVGGYIRRSHSQLRL